mgnify:FL=1
MKIEKEIKEAIQSEVNTQGRLAFSRGCKVTYTTIKLALENGYCGEAVYNKMVNYTLQSIKNRKQIIKALKHD